MGQLVVVYGAPVRGIESRQIVPLLGGRREWPDGAPVRGRERANVPLLGGVGAGRWYPVRGRGQADGFGYGVCRC
jgi:hypothetical protein